MLRQLLNELLLYQRSSREEAKSKTWQDFQDRCYASGVLNEKKFKQFAADLMETVFSVEAKTEMMTVFKNQKLTPEAKIKHMLEIAVKTGEFDHPSVKNMGLFLEVIKTEQALVSFLKDPRATIRNHTVFSPLQINILQIAYNEPFCRELVNKVSPQTVKWQDNVETELTAQMRQLRLSEYGSRDARTFEHSINPAVKIDVLARSERMSYGPPVIGLAGAGAAYTRSLIANTAKQVRTQKMGECHTFAQLAADHLLTQMETGMLPPVSVKIVSHQAGRGSHTFLLLGHQTDNLKDLSNCLIIDPWAVAMGHGDSHGVFTFVNYPYRGMATNLQESYNSERDTVHQQNLSRIAAAPANYQTAGRMSPALSTATVLNALDVNIHAAPSPPVMPASTVPVASVQAPARQEIAKQDIQTFLAALTSFCGQAVTFPENKAKAEIINALNEQIKANTIDPQMALISAVDVFFADSIKRDVRGNYSWKTTANVESLLFSNPLKIRIQQDFNALPAIKTSLVDYLAKRGTVKKDEQIASLTLTLLAKLATTTSSDAQIKRTYQPPKISQPSTSNRRNFGVS